MRIYTICHWAWFTLVLNHITLNQLNRLQRLLNAAARVTCYIPRYAHITLVLKELHWLPVPHRINYKTALLIFKALHGMAPSYLIELLQTKTVTSYALRCNNQSLLKAPRTFVTCHLWWQVQLSGTACQSPSKDAHLLKSFKPKLKTYIFFQISIWIIFLYFKLVTVMNLFCSVEKYV